MIDLFGKRHYFFIISIVIMLAGLIGLLINGVQLDIQFQGGTLMQIEMNDDQYDIGKVETLISNKIGKKVSAQKMQTFNPKDANSKINLLQLKAAMTDTLSGEQLNMVVDTLKKEFNVKEDAEMQVRSVAPFMGREMMEKGLLAALIASVLIILYVWWRFAVMSGLSAAVFANLALIHDALFMFFMYVLFKLPLNESFVAAVLTILGYSINDTIIIYDRIRENTRTSKKMSYAELVNTSVIQTLGRSINTTLTSIICIVTLYVFAHINNIPSIKEFTLPLIVGLISGTYSTIFIASPLWAMWQQAKAKKRIASKPSNA